MPGTEPPAPRKPVSREERRRVGAARGDDEREIGELLPNSARTPLARNPAEGSRPRLFAPDPLAGGLRRATHPCRGRCAPRHLRRARARSRSSADRSRAVMPEGGGASRSPRPAAAARGGPRARAPSGKGLPSPRARPRARSRAPALPRPRHAILPRSSASPARSRRRAGAAPRRARARIRKIGSLSSCRSLS